MKPSIRNGVLTFEQRGFHGGRQRLKGDGYVRLEFSFDQTSREVQICTFDKLNTEDGHYAPLSLSRDQVAVLSGWLSSQIKGGK